MKEIDLKIIIAETRHFVYEMTSDWPNRLPLLVWLVLSTSLSIPCLGQFWDVRYEIQTGEVSCADLGGSQDGFSPIGEVSTSFFVRVNSQIISTNVSLGSFKRTGSFQVTASGSASLTCCFDTAPPSGCQTTSSSASIVVQSPANGCPGTFTNGGASITFLRDPIPAPTVSLENDGSGCFQRVNLQVDPNSSVNYQWQVTDDITNPTKWSDFGSNSPNIEATVDELFKSGFLSKFSRRWVRVIDPNCRQVVGNQSIDFKFSVSAPQFTLIPTATKCNNSADGSIELIITPADPVISAFWITIYTNPSGSSGSIVRQGDELVYSGLPPGMYYVAVENNTESSVYGACKSALVFVSIGQAPPIEVRFNPVKQITCHLSSDGEITVNPSGGTNEFKNFQWSNSAATPKITGLSAGTYRVDFQDSNNCDASGSITLTDPPPVTVTLTNSQPIPGFQVSCDDKRDGQISASASSSRAIVSYSWSNGSNEAVNSNLVSGSYTVTVVDAAGCTAEATAVLAAKPKLDFSFHPIVNNVCAGGQDGQVAVNVGSITNAVGSPEFSWSGALGSNPIVSNLRAGVYSVTVADARGALCAVTKSQSLVDPDSYSVQLAALTPFNGQAISCKNEDDGTIQAQVINNATGTPVSSGLLYRWFRGADSTPFDSGPTRSSRGNLAAGTYRVEVTYNSICVAQQTFVLNDPTPVAPQIGISSDFNGLPIRCRGESNGILMASASGGTPGYSFQWSNGPAAAEYNGLSAGTYSVTVRDANGCEASITRTLTDPSPVMPLVNVLSNFSGLAIRCAGESNAHLSASASGGTGAALGYSYVWSTGATSTELVGVPAGTYQVTATDRNGCTGQTNRSIVNPAPVVAGISVSSNFNGRAISCNGAANGALVASAGGGTNNFSYVWNSNPSLTGQALSGLPAGSYSVTVQDTNGCPASATIAISDPDPVRVDSIKTSRYRGFGVSCAGATDGSLVAFASGGTGALRFEWISTTETSNTLAQVGAGSYSVLVRDVNGCQSTATATLLSPSPVSLTIVRDRDVTCFNGQNGEIQLAASGGAPAYEFSRDGLTWQTSNLFTSLRAQPYTLYLRDANTCTTTQSNTLTQPPPILISFTDIEPAYCADPRGKARAIVSGGVGGFTYEWRTSANLIFDQDLLIENLSPGIYTLNVTDANLCPASAPVGITSADGPVIEVGEKVEPKCSYSADGRILITATGNGPFEYRWSNGQQTAILQNVEQGTYISSVRDVNGCLTTKTIELNAPEPLAIKLVEATNPACFGDANGTITVEASGGKSGYAYQWASTSGAQATSLPKGTHLVTVTDSNNCVAQSSFSLSEPDVLSVSLTERILPLCFGGCNGSLAVDATGGNGDYQFLWNNETKTKKASQLCSGNFSVSVVDKKGCQTTQSYSLGQPAPLQIRVLENRAPDCFDGCNGRLQVDAIGGTGNTQWLWNSGATNPERTGLCAGTYGVTVTDANGCQTSSSYTIANPEKLMIDLGEGVTLCVGQTYVLDAGAQWASYAWTSNTGLTSNQQRVVIQNAGRYQVVVKNALGCEASDEFLLETSRDLLKASFLLPAEAAVQDTVAFIDVSWPLPERAQWTFPAEMRKVIDLGDVVFGRFEKSGTYSISLLATLGECRDVLAKNIRIVPASGKVAGGRLGYQETVKAFELYPNPSAGNFQVLIELSQKEPVTLSVWNPVVGRTVAIHRADGDWVHHLSFELDHLGPGTYVLRLDYPQGSQYRRFVITK